MKFNIRINAKEVTYGNSKFIACTTLVNGTWFKVKFTNECEKAPKTRGVYKLTFDKLHSSIEKGKPYTSKAGKNGIGNDIIWIREIDEIVKFTDEELAEINGAEVEKALNGCTAVDVDVELPF